MSKAEAVLIDPQQRLLMEGYAAAAAHDATHHAQASALSDPASAGVYVGVSQLEYARIALEQSVPLAAYYATGAHLSVTSGRIAYTFNLRGATVTIDTACSSSLVATHLAAK
jgi:acyl transferase domain-containing protein